MDKHYSVPESKLSDGIYQGKGMHKLVVEMSEDLKMSNIYISSDNEHPGC
jgi:hypothetical protein